jgi:aspartate-semialdehyde dehydrogenase
VVHGHLAHVFIDFARDVDVDDVAAILRAPTPGHDAARSPTLPEHPIRVLDEPDRPQPALDLDPARGMEVVVGRIRGGGRRIALTVLSHNLVRGAAGACLANAELLVSRG